MRNYRVRVVLAVSLDGRIAMPNGGKAVLGKRGDRRALEESLAWADGTLIGGETLRDYKTTCLIKDQDLLNKRLSEGKSEQPIAIIVSTQKNFANNWPFFSQPVRRWLLNKNYLGRNSPSPEGYERQIYLKQHWKDTLDELATMGLHKLVILGGGKLASSLLDSDQIDEIQLTITPRIIGGEYAWVPLKKNDLPIILSNDNAWTLQRSQPLEDNELLVRYIRNR